MKCCGFNDFKWFMEFIGKPSGIIGSWREEWVQHTGISLSSEEASLVILNTNENE